MHIYIYIYICIYICTCIYVYTHMCIHVNLYSTYAAHVSHACLLRPDSLIMKESPRWLANFNL